MVHFKANTLAALTALVALLPGAQSSPYIISDDRVRSLDATPALGRGYSIMTNSFKSTCLNITDVTTVPSYNYDCKCSTSLCAYHIQDYSCLVPLYGGTSYDLSFKRANDNANDNANDAIFPLFVNP